MAIQIPLRRSLCGAHLHRFSEKVDKIQHQPRLSTFYITTNQPPHPTHLTSIPNNPPQPHILLIRVILKPAGGFCSKFWAGMQALLMHHLAPPTKSYTHLLFPHHKHIKPHKTTSQYHNTPHSNTIPTPQTPLTHHHSLHTTLPSPQHHHNTTLHNTTTHSSIPIHLNSHPSSHKRLFRIPAECMCARAPKFSPKSGQTRMSTQHGPLLPTDLITSQILPISHQLLSTHPNTTFHHNSH